VTFGLARRALLLTVALLGVGPGLRAEPADAAVVGKVGAESVTSADVVAQDPAAFAQLQTERARQLHQVELQYAQAYHELLQEKLDALLDKRALELEAKARGTTTAAVLSQIKPAPVTDAEVRAFWEARRERTDQPFEKLVGPIQQFLVNAHREAAARRLYDTLRVRYGIRAALEPYRMNVAASGPARGPATAAVTIIEFADFQCPFCRKEEPVLQALLAHYPHDVRLVFRNLPLADLHANATVAAQAGVCADQQGKFWPMHDAMYQDQTALSATALNQTAGHLGLDQQRFASCLAHEAETRAALSADAEAAADMGIASTPYFFVNGRPLHGTVPAEEFEKIVAGELSRARADRS